MVLGWCRLHQEYLSYDSTGLLKPIELGHWIPKSFNLDDYLPKGLYFVERKLTRGEPIPYKKSKGIITTDWLLYYDFLYSRQCRDPRFSYGKKIFSAH